MIGPAGSGRSAARSSQVGLPHGSSRHGHPVHAESLDYQYLRQRVNSSRQRGNAAGGLDVEATTVTASL